MVSVCLRQILRMERDLIFSSIIFDELSPVNSPTSLLLLLLCSHWFGSSVIFICLLLGLYNIVYKREYIVYKRGYGAIDEVFAEGGDEPTQGERYPEGIIRYLGRQGEEKEEKEEQIERT